MIDDNTMRRAGEGDLKAIEEVCSGTWKSIYAFIYYKVQNREEAEDITQEAYTRLIEYAGKGHITPGKHTGFLKTVAMNLLRDKWRKRKRHGISVDLDDLCNEVTDGRDITEEYIDRAVIECALDSLNEEQRKVIDLRIIKGYSVAETSKMTGKSEGAVRSLQFRAIQNLTRTLNEGNLGKEGC